jgi:ketosteroid isomerase-like protein
MDAEAKQKVEEAINSFYIAIDSRSIERMEGIWLREESVCCVHPGWDIVVGWSRVKESWARIFESGPHMKISPADVWVRSYGDIAWVTCTENITVFNEESFESVQTVATNLFVRRDGHWLLIHHHASMVPMIMPDTALETVQ